MPTPEDEPAGEPGGDPRMLARLHVVNEVSEVALAHPAAGDIYRSVAESLADHFAYFGASLFAIDHGSQRAVLVAQSPPRDSPGYSQPVSAGLVGAALRERHSVLVNDVRRDSRYVAPPAGEGRCAAELCVPVLRDGEVAAVIDVESRAPGAFDDGDRLALEAIANVVGLALGASEAYAELERQVDRLRDTQCQLMHSERLADIGRLTSRVAHEIRNPLATIGGFARRIREHSGDPPTVARHAAIVVEEVERLERLLSGIMDFVRPGLPQKESVDLLGVLERALTLSAGSRKGKRIAVRRECEGDLPPLWADPAQLEQVFINLIQNAYDAMTDGGILTVVARRRDDQLVVRLSDTGGGITPEHLEHIFDPFYSTKQGGNGLGLAVASKIVDDHGGHILIGSEPGSGTHVNVRLPIGHPPDNEQGAPRVHLAPSP